MSHFRLKLLKSPTTILDKIVLGDQSPTLTEENAFVNVLC